MLGLFKFCKHTGVRLYSTIYALSSGQGKCGVAVIRVSGTKAAEVILKMTKRTSLPEPRRAVLTQVLHPQTKEQLDRGIVLWFPGPRSFTGEDCCELQVHGGPAVLSAILTALSSLPDYRPATPGEFTKRAFIAGRIDLTEVEGLADLIHAETEQQRRQALLQMEGSLSQLYNKWRTELIKCVAHVEAYIDFSEDDNIEQNVLEVVKTSLRKLTSEMEEHLKDGRKGERLHNGVRAAILGEPNVGKSSLLNYLEPDIVSDISSRSNFKKVFLSKCVCETVATKNGYPSLWFSVGRAAAIVAPVAGTTRDVVEVPIDIGGYPLLIADTAGQRTNPTDDIEQEGIKRAKAWAQSSDLALILVDARQVIQFSNWTEFMENRIKNIGLDSGGESINIVNKIDFLTNPEKDQLKSLVKDDATCISCTTTEGLSDLIKIVTNKLEKLCGNPGREAPSLSQERHRHFIKNSLINIEEGINICNESGCLIAAHQLRKALKQLGEITGHVTTEDVLDVLFKDFCIGK